MNVQVSESQLCHSYVGMSILKNTCHVCVLSTELHQITSSMVDPYRALRNDCFVAPPSVECFIAIRVHAYVYHG